MFENNPRHLFSILMNMFPDGDFFSKLLKFHDP